jgi:hypothetical protein
MSCFCFSVLFWLGNTETRQRFLHILACVLGNKYVSGFSNCVCIGPQAPNDVIDQRGPPTYLHTKYQSTKRSKSLVSSCLIS